MPNPNCRFDCMGCTKENPDPPQMKMINNIPHLSVRPGCHPRVEEHPYTPGGRASAQPLQMEQQQPTAFTHQPGAEVW